MSHHRHHLTTNPDFKWLKTLHELPFTGWSDQFTHNVLHLRNNVKATFDYPNQEHNYYINKCICYCFFLINTLLNFKAVTS